MDNKYQLNGNKWKVDGSKSVTEKNESKQVKGEVPFLFFKGVL